MRVRAAQDALPPHPGCRHALWIREDRAAFFRRCRSSRPTAASRGSEEPTTLAETAPRQSSPGRILRPGELCRCVRGATTLRDRERTGERDLQRFSQ